MGHISIWNHNLTLFIADAFCLLLFRKAIRFLKSNWTGWKSWFLTSVFHFTLFWSFELASFSHKWCNNFTVAEKRRLQVKWKSWIRLTKRAVLSGKMPRCVPAPELCTLRWNNEWKEGKLVWENSEVICNSKIQCSSEEGKVVTTKGTWVLMKF